MHALRVTENVPLERKGEGMYAHKVFGKVYIIPWPKGFWRKMRRRKFTYRLVSSTPVNTFIHSFSICAICKIREIGHKIILSKVKLCNLSK